MSTLRRTDQRYAALLAFNTLQPCVVQDVARFLSLPVTLVRDFKSMFRVHGLIEQMPAPEGTVYYVRQFRKYRMTTKGIKTLTKWKGRKA